MASADGSPRVLIAGGGVASLEALLALRELAGNRISLDLVSPGREFVYRPLAVAAPFKLGEAPHFDLDEIALELGARRHAGTLAAVDAERHVARLADGEELPFDALLVASGAEPQDGVPGALTYRGPDDGEAFARLLGELERGEAESVVFAVPSGATWPLPLYELALMTGTRLGGAAGVTLMLVTPEDSPLGLFGRQASDAVASLLAERGIEVRTSTHPVEFRDGRLTTVPAGSVHAERAVTLPRLRGRPPAGLPHDEEGFVPVDPYGRVQGLRDVYAAGDVTAFPIKQGGIATQQADAAAEAIAAGFGIQVEPRPFRPVLRGMLLTGEGARHMRAEVTGGRGEVSEVSGEMLWWPDGKIAARHLTHFLARHAKPLEPAKPLAADAIPVDVELGGTSVS